MLIQIRRLLFLFMPADAFGAQARTFDMLLRRVADASTGGAA